MADSALVLYRLVSEGLFCLEGSIEACTTERRMDRQVEQPSRRRLQRGALWANAQPHWQLA